MKVECLNLILPYVFLPELHASLCSEYEAASDARKLELEMKYGRQVIHRAVQETHSNRWLEDNSKQCPCCGTFIQVKYD